MYIYVYVHNHINKQCERGLFIRLTLAYNNPASVDMP